MQTEDNKEFPEEAMTKEELESEVFALREDLKEYKRIWEKVSLILLQNPSNPNDVFFAARLAMAGIQERSYANDVEKAAGHFPDFADLHRSLDLAMLHELDRYHAHMRKLADESKITDAALATEFQAKRLPIVNLREKWEKFCKKVGWSA